MCTRIACMIVVFVFLGNAISCVKNQDFESITDACEENLVANATFADVKALYQGELLQIQEDWVIQGYVISSDRAGNFFSVLHFQDAPAEPIEGFQIAIDLFESHLLFEPGSKVLIKTKGLYLGQSKGIFRLGGTFAAFGATNVGRLPALKIPEHIFRSCDQVAAITPRKVRLDELDNTLTNTLVTIDSLEFVEHELGLPFAEPREETERTLKDCEGNELVLVNSGFADFQGELLPGGNGSVIGVLLRENDDFQLVIRDLDDVSFSNERCEEPVTEFTSNQIFFSELADPNNNAGARFVELYNAGNQPLDLNGWSIHRYTNANTEVSSTLDLSGFTIGALGTFVISPNAATFEAVYGFAPDMGVSTNSPADSNGDDNLVLVDPFGSVIDVFGVIGEDGSGTDHEFEDGRALRKVGVSQANPIYTFSEWTVYNDTGAAGTINQPQNAPEDFSPGQR
ncbi:MAG: nuclease [Muricauda sp.]|nr:nuclease [Allomuricauda sp.]